MTNLRYGTTATMFITVLLAGLCLASGTPKKISYQGRVTDPSGNPVTDGNYSCTFVLYDHPSMGTSRWSEIAIVATTGGLYSHLLGSNAPLPDSLFAEYDSLYLQVYFSGQTISPRTPIVSTGYAMRVNSIDGAKGGLIDGGTVWMDTTADKPYGVMRLDGSGNGAGYFEVRKDGGASGLTVEGNYLGTGELYLSLDGTTRDVIFNTSVAGSSGVLLPADAIEANEILDEPGVGSCNNTSVILSTTPSYLCGRTMFAPVDGYVLVMATAHVGIAHTNGTASNVSFGVSDNITSYVSSSLAKLSLPSSLPTGIYRFPISSHALFPISAGSHAYYVLGSKTSTAATDASEIQFTECFFPTAYTTVTPPNAASVAPPNPDAERIEAEAFHKKRVDDELARMKAEIDLLKKQLERKNDESPVN